MIRSQQPGDTSAVRQVLTAAFNDEGRVATMAEALRKRSDGGTALVAVDDDGGVVGLVQVSVSWVDAPDGVVEVLVLSPLAVTPSRQHQGIGTTLLSAGREAAERLRAPLLFLEGDPGYYSARGWRPAVDLGFAAPSERIPDPAFQVLPLRGYDPIAMRGKFIYNDTFWSHDCVGLRGAALAQWMSPGGDALDG